MLRYLLQVLMMKRMTMAYLILQVIMSLYMSKILGGLDELHEEKESQCMEVSNIEHLQQGR